jgi:hypothetical protein
VETGLKTCTGDINQDQKIVDIEKLRHFKDGVNVDKICLFATEGTLMDVDKILIEAYWSLFQQTPNSRIKVVSAQRVYPRANTQIQMNITYHTIWHLSTAILRRKST